MYCNSDQVNYPRNFASFNFTAFKLVKLNISKRSCTVEGVQTYENWGRHCINTDSCSEYQFFRIKTFKISQTCSMGLYRCVWQTGIVAFDPVAATGRWDGCREGRGARLGDWDTVGEMAYMLPGGTPNTLHSLHTHTHTTQTPLSGSNISHGFSFRLLQTLIVLC